MKEIKTSSRGSRGAVYATLRRSTRLQEKNERTVARVLAEERSRVEAAAAQEHARYLTAQSNLPHFPLETFRDSRHLTNIMYDIAKAIEYLHGVGIRHHDLSVPNIVIDPEGNGRLIDFDLARPENWEWGAAGAATWQFVSTERLLTRGKAYETSDELESFFFIILYEGIHWVIHDKVPGLDPVFIFDTLVVCTDGRQTGGTGKQNMYTQKYDMILKKLSFKETPPFTRLVRKLFRLFRSLAIVNRDKRLYRKLQGRDVANVKRLESWKAVLKLMKDAVESVDWPAENDKAANNNYPREQRDKGGWRHAPVIERVDCWDIFEHDMPDRYY